VSRVPRAAVIAALGFAMAIPLAACSGTASTASSASAPAVTGLVPANPVPLLRATGATPDPGEILGSTDVEGDRYASGSYPDGETISVYTFASTADQAADLARNDIPSDAHAIITTPLVDYYVTAVDGVDGYTFTVTPAQIAARVKGKLVGR
jgi:hypothetical protein